MANDHTIGTALEEIDQVLGKGYAKEHPEMVAAWLQANAIAKAAARIGDAINGLNEVLRSNHPPQGETLEQALDTISDALKRRTRG
ncbi:MAG TPA: hypothetical protein VNV13_09325 [Steroidobacteraceae bacterium]|jgi:predicted RNase H-like HicB family nuclease|nr:hypothetical protein [Steroidobacteraceae bacterium]